MPTTEGLTPERSEILERYFREQYEELLHYAIFLLRDQGLAEVAVQDTFETATIRFDAFTGSPNPAGWLRRVVYNKVREIRREQKMMLKHFVSLESVPEQSGEMKLPSSFDSNTDENIQLLLRLYVEGYSIRELAQEAGKTEGAMKMKLKRARDRLRQSPDFPDSLDL